MRTVLRLRTLALVTMLLLGFGQQLFSSEPVKTGLEPCPKVDPSYIRTANETGGIPMFLLRSEAAKSFHLVRESTRNNMSTVFWATGAIDRPPQVVELPIDSATHRITFTVSFDTEGSGATILPPSG